ncbi:Cilia- and flagella-associated protein 157 [Nymphon striatum]|nr:Cilia- and flagella-associated protein 157 [Nymphon striatum]
MAASNGFCCHGNIVYIFSSIFQLRTSSSNTVEVAVELIMSDQKATKPKNKSGLKKAKKSKGKNEKAEKKTTNTKSKKSESLTEVQKELFRVQIEELNEKVERISEERDQLQGTTNNLQEKYDNLSKENDDIAHYLKDCLNNKEAEVIELQERLHGLLESHKYERKKLNIKISDIENEMSKSLKEVQTENDKLSLKLATLEEFEIQKNDLTNKLKYMEEQLIKQKQDYEEEIYLIECNSTVYKDRLLEENNEKLDEITKDLEQKSLAKMTETVKYALKENITLISKLTAITNHCTFVKNKVISLETKMKMLKEEINVFKISEQHLVSKNVKNMKIIEDLTNKCEKMNEMFDTNELVKKENIKCMSETEDIKKKLQTAQQTIDALRQNYELLKSQNSLLTQQLESKTDRIFCLEDIFQQVSTSVSELLLANQMNPLISSVNDESLNHILYLLDAKCSENSNIHTLDVDDKKDPEKNQNEPDEILANVLKT